MPLNMNEVENKQKKRIQYDPVPRGSHMARLVRVLDMGLQPRPAFDGQEKAPAYKIRLTFELPKQRIAIDGESRPRWIDKEITVSTFENSNMVKYYKVLDPDNTSKGDWGKLVGSECAVVVIHDQGQGKHAGKTYDKVQDITPLMDGIECPELENDSVTFDLSSPDMDVFQSLPEFIQNTIKSNLEFQGSKLQKLLEGQEIPVTASTEQLDAEAEMDSDGGESDDQPW